jgi:hypothetical protein
MAIITLQINGTTVGDMSVTTTLDQQNSDRLMMYLAATYGIKTVDGQPTQATPQEMVESYWAGIIAGTATNVERFEKVEAAQAAQDAVPAFTVS